MKLRRFNETFFRCMIESGLNTFRDKELEQKFGKLDIINNPNYTASFFWVQKESPFLEQSEWDVIGDVIITTNHESRHPVFFLQLQSSNEFNIITKYLSIGCFHVNCRLWNSLEISYKEYYDMSKRYEEEQLCKLAQ